MKTKLGHLEKSIRTRFEWLGENRFTARLFAKDASLWSNQPSVQKNITDRLGWVDLSAAIRGKTEPLQETVESWKKEGFSALLLLGMGGSSLCAEVLQKCLGTQPGFMNFRILDSTHPRSVYEAEKFFDLKKTLFAVSSKSGTTTEILSFYRYFFGKTGDPRQFTAITDPGSPLQTLAEEAGFRQIFLNPPDIGGRYSTLSFFGLIPAMAMGLDIRRLWESFDRMRSRCSEETIFGENPGVSLGAILGQSALEGADKLTLFFSPQLAPLGDWIEQLVAESTGKQGKGLLPVVEDFPEDPRCYGKDRLFVATSLRGSENFDARLEALEEAGFPVVRIEIENSFEIAGEFFRWMVATAGAGCILEVNPFDEPNVQQSKECTRRLLEEASSSGDLESGHCAAKDEGLLLFLAEDRRAEWKEVLAQTLKELSPGDYVSFLAFLHPEEGVFAELRRMLGVFRKNKKIAATLGWGPRYLHSTGQFHKGGADRGVFFLLTSGVEKDLSIPGVSWGFNMLKQAQALGDFQALTQKGRKVLHFHFSEGLLQGLERLRREIERGI